MTQAAWGTVMMLIGGLFVFWASTQSEFFLYRLFVARSRMSMGDQVHRFFQLVGVAILLVGLLMAFGLI